MRVCIENNDLHIFLANFFNILFTRPNYFGIIHCFFIIWWLVIITRHFLVKVELKIQWEYDNYNNRIEIEIKNKSQIRIGYGDLHEPLSSSSMCSATLKLPTTRSKIN